MKIEGKLLKTGKFWAVEIPLLLIHTQGHSKKDALEMAKDAVEGVVNVEDFEAEVIEVNSETFIVGSENERALLAAVLRQQRASRNLSVRDVAARLGSNSPTSYSRYEGGSVKLSLEKFTELLQAIDSEAEPVLNLVRKPA